MKIALISPPWIAVPPIGYGGTENVVYHLTEGLVKRGHDVTLHATGDSMVSSKLTYFFKEALGNNLTLKFHPYNMLSHIFQFFKFGKPEQFDVIHNHSGRTTSYFMDLFKVPCLHTIHGNYVGESKKHTDQSGIDVLYEFRHHGYISISDNQRLYMPKINFIDTVYNGAVVEDFKFDAEGGNALVWLGRITPTKGVEDLISTALKLNEKLRIAAFVDRGETDYFTSRIQPLLANNMIDYLSEIKLMEEKSKFLSSGRVFLFPIQWDEPFGLVMIESMAVGTPVVAFARGSVPEIIKDGVTGFIVNPSDSEIKGDWITKKTGIEGLCEATRRIYTMSKDEYREMRLKCRSHVEQNFTVDVMVRKYELAYLKLITQAKAH